VSPLEAERELEVLLVADQHVELRSSRFTSDARAGPRSTGRARITAVRGRRDDRRSGSRSGGPPGRPSVYRELVASVDVLIGTRRLPARARFEPGGQPTSSCRARPRRVRRALRARAGRLPNVRVLGATLRAVHSQLERLGRRLPLGDDLHVARCGRARDLRTGSAVATRSRRADSTPAHGLDPQQASERRRPRALEIRRPAMCHGHARRGAQARGGGGGARLALTVARYGGRRPRPADGRQRGDYLRSRCDRSWSRLCRSPGRRRLDIVLAVTAAERRVVLKQALPRSSRTGVACQRSARLPRPRLLRSRCPSRGVVARVLDVESERLRPHDRGGTGRLGHVKERRSPVLPAPPRRSPRRAARRLAPRHERADAGSRRVGFVRAARIDPYYCEVAGAIRTSQRRSSRTPTRWPRVGSASCTATSRRRTSS